MKQKPTLRSKVKGSDPEAVREILASNRYFYDFEIRVALELVDDRLERGRESEYRFIFAEIPKKVIGYTCYGQVPCTRQSFDLYWIAVREEFRGQGIGSLLLGETEKAIRARAGGRVYIETSSRPDYEPTRRFYRKSGYRLVAALEDFYAPGDAKQVWVKVL